MQKETEVKFVVSSSRAARALLKRGGARFESRAFEQNYVFDDVRGSLRKQKKLLRLRRQGKNTRLTFKEPVASKHFKVRWETEFYLDDFKEAKALLEKLGYRVSWVYEKRRERWRLPGVLATVDELPFGCYVELEGEPSAVRRAAKRLGLGFGKAIKKNYLELFEAKGLKGNAVF